ncbi:MAG: hypothetical protein V1720_11530 [bacterium]
MNLLHMKNVKYFIIVLLISFQLNAQEIGLSGVKTWTNNYEFQNPIGFNINIYQKIWKIGLKLDYTYAVNEREYYGLILYGFFGYDHIPVWENVKSHSFYNAVDLSLIIPDILEVEENFLNAGFGYEWNTFAGYRTGSTSNKRVNLFDESKPGFFYTLSISRYDIFNLSLKAELIWKQKFLTTDICVEDLEQPFEDLEDIIELQLNIAYVFKH